MFAHVQTQLTANYNNRIQIRGETQTHINSKLIALQCISAEYLNEFEYTNEQWHRPWLCSEV